jgi:hypothetical protein
MGCSPDRSFGLLDGSIFAIFDLCGAKTKFPHILGGHRHCYPYRVFRGVGLDCFYDPGMDQEARKLALLLHRFIRSS